MIKRPLSFTIISLTFLLSPVFKLSYLCFFKGISLEEIIHSTTTPLEFYNFWLLYPSFALAIYLAKIWSYPLLLVGLSYSFFQAIDPVNAFHLPTPLILASNLFMVIYFSIPDQSIFFFKKGFRHWERKKRFETQLPCSYYNSGEMDLLKSAALLNISKTGLYFTTERIEPMGETIYINLTYESYFLKIKIEVMHNYSYRNKHGYGAEFIFENIWQQIAVKKMVKAISKNNHKDLLMAA